jgi:hypothetical protein
LSLQKKNMKKPLLIAALGCLVTLPLAAQIGTGGLPYGLRSALDRSDIPTVQPARFDTDAVAAEDAARASWRT